MKKLLLLICLSASVLTTTAQWVVNDSIPTKFKTKILYSVYFVNKDTGYVTTTLGWILHTTNGGLTWDAQTNANLVATMTSVYFVNPRVGYSVGSGTSIIATLDGGITWDIINQSIHGYLRSVYFTDTLHGFSVGEKALLKTDDGAQSWEIKDTLHMFRSVHFPTAHTGYAVGDTGIIYKTTDAGVNWTTMTFDTSQKWKSVYFADSITGYVVGNSGAIYKTVNGGTHWTSQSSGVTSTLNSVCFINASRGYAVGDAGVILKTIDGGANWTKEVSPKPNALTSVYFVDMHTGYAVGTGGLVLKCTDATADITKNSHREGSLFSSSFNPSEKSYKFFIALETPQSVSMEIYNVLGIKVATLATNKQLQGKQQLTWNIAEQADGVYFARIIVDGITETKKLIVEK